MLEFIGNIHLRTFTFVYFVDPLGMMGVGGEGEGWRCQPNSTSTFYFTKNQFYVGNGVSFMQHFNFFSLKLMQECRRAVLSCLINASGDLFISTSRKLHSVSQYIRYVRIVSPQTSYARRNSLSNHQPSDLSEFEFVFVFIDQKF